MPARHNRAAGALTAETACELCRWRRAARGSLCAAERARHAESNAPRQQQILSNSSTFLLHNLLLHSARGKDAVLRVRVVVLAVNLGLRGSGALLLLLQSRFSEQAISGLLGFARATTPNLPYSPVPRLDHRSCSGPRALPARHACDRAVTRQVAWRAPGAPRSCSVSRAPPAAAAAAGQRQGAKG